MTPFERFMRYFRLGILAWVIYNSSLFAFGLALIDRADASGCLRWFERVYLLSDLQGFLQAGDWDSALAFILASIGSAIIALTPLLLWLKKRNILRAWLLALSGTASQPMVELLIKIGPEDWIRGPIILSLTYLGAGILYRLAKSLYRLPLSTSQPPKNTNSIDSKNTAGGNKQGPPGSRKDYNLKHLLWFWALTWFIFNSGLFAFGLIYIKQATLRDCLYWFCRIYLLSDLPAFFAQPTSELLWNGITLAMWCSALIPLPLYLWFKKQTPGRALLLALAGTGAPPLLHFFHSRPFTEWIFGPVILTIGYLAVMFFCYRHKKHPTPSQNALESG